MQVGIDLVFGYPQRSRGNTGYHLVDVVVRVWQEFVERQDFIDQTQFIGFFCQKDTAREQDIIRPRDAHQAREQPGQAKLGRQVQGSVGSCEFRSFRGKTNIGIAGDSQASTSDRAVNGRNHRFGQAELIREIRVKLGPDAIARSRHGVWRAWVVATFFNMSFKRPRIRPNTKIPARPGHENGPHLRVVLGLLNRPAILNVHSARPRVPALRTVEGNGRDPVFDGVCDDFPFHSVPFYTYGLPPPTICQARERRKTQCLSAAL